jgi:hypothetical protein
VIDWRSAQSRFLKSWSRYRYRSLPGFPGPGAGRGGIILGAGSTHAGSFGGATRLPAVAAVRVHRHARGGVETSGLPRGALPRIASASNLSLRSTFGLLPFALSKGVVRSGR